MKRGLNLTDTSESEEEVHPEKRARVDARWACTACTFLNEALHLACGICGTPRQPEVRTVTSLGLARRSEVDDFASIELARKLQEEEQAAMTRKLLHEEHMKEFAKRVNWGDERRPWNKPGALVSSTGQKEYRKIQVIIGFGWLCFDPRGHMTILDWYDRNLGHPLTEFHVRRVKEICDKYRKIARKSDAVGGVGNTNDTADNSFLFDPESDPPVDPEGVLSRMLGEFSQIPISENNPNGPKIKYWSTGGGGLQGLHVTAGVDPSKCPRRQTDFALRARHGSTKWMQSPRFVHVLPMNVKEVAVNPAPLPVNEALFEFLMQEGAPSAATRIANATSPIKNVRQAYKLRGIGKKYGKIIERFFQKQ